MSKVISGDGSATLFNERYGQTYHSVHGAITESTLVYLKNSGVLARLEQGLDSHVLEIGFGLGLNFLLTARAALQFQTTLKYHAFEHAPISKDVFTTLAYENIKGLTPLTSPTADLFQTLSHTSHASLAFENIVQLDVHNTDALTAPLQTAYFDAIYLDAFSPDTNPELWSTRFLKKLRTTLKPGGTVSTYCVKGVVRRAFAKAGFEVSKLPGPPGKREVLVAKVYC